MTPFCHSTADFYIKWHYIRTKNFVLITVDKPLSKNRLHAKVWLQVAIHVFQAIVSEPLFLLEWDFQSCANYPPALKLTGKKGLLSNIFLPLCREGWLFCIYRSLPPPQCCQLSLILCWVNFLRQAKLVECLWNFSISIQIIFFQEVKLVTLWNFFTVHFILDLVVVNLVVYLDLVVVYLITKLQLI